MVSQRHGLILLFHICTILWLCNIFFFAVSHKAVILHQVFPPSLSRRLTPVDICFEKLLSIGNQAC